MKIPKVLPLTEKDLATFRELVTSGLATAYSQLQNIVASQKLYAFGLYTHGEFNYLTATANTEEGLAKVVKEYRKNPRDRNKSDSNLSAQLRWSPADFEYHLCGDEPLAAASEFLSSRHHQAWQFYRTLNKSKQDDFLDTLEKDWEHVIRNAMLLCLRSFRDVVPAFSIVSIWMGDQSEEERIGFVRELNSPAAAERFKRESEEGIRLFLES